MTDTIDWEKVAAAVADAAYRVEEAAAGELDAGEPVGAVAAVVLDAGLKAVEARQRVGRRAEPDKPLDGKVFGRQVLADLAQFLRTVRQGALTRQEIVEEARMWRPLLLAGWPPEARDAGPVGAAVELLASLPDAEREPVRLRHVEPANDLERAIVAARQDTSARPKLWQALHDGEIVLPVVGYELVRRDGAMFRFLTAPLDRRPLVFGFTSDERFDAVLKDAPVTRVTPLGRDLPKFWPKGHGLMINPGFDDHIVLIPHEIAALPHGPRQPGGRRDGV
jgi:type III secretion system (T3SS) SseB-like protein